MSGYDRAPAARNDWARYGVARVFSVSCFHLLTVATTAWVGLSLFLLNYAPTAIGIGTSHGFYDHSNTVFGWPIIYCHGQLSTPQLGGVSPRLRRYRSSIGSRPPRWPWTSP